MPSVDQQTHHHSLKVTFSPSGAPPAIQLPKHQRNHSSPHRLWDVRVQHIWIAAPGISGWHTQQRPHRCTRLHLHRAASAGSGPVSVCGVLVCGSLNAWPRNTPTSCTAGCLNDGTMLNNRTAPGRRLRVPAIPSPSLAQPAPPAQPGHSNSSPGTPGK